MTRDTSLTAYKEIKPKISLRQQQVLNAIKMFPDSTDLELTVHTGLAINSVTPRRGELELKHLIFSSGIKRQSNGKSAHQWRAKQ
jgi:hypothetical protein